MENTLHSEKRKLTLSRLEILSSMKKLEKTNGKKSDLLLTREAEESPTNKSQQ
jgi:hypothetical protein